MEIARSVDQRRIALAHFLEDRHDDLVRQGTVVATWRKRNGRKLGPYFQLVCRDDGGRQRSCYLGPEGEIVAFARAKLASLQSPLRNYRQVSEVRRQLSRELAAAKKSLDVELAVLGLERKGMEIRGWTNATSFIRQNEQQKIVCV